jgi:SagB-type dehydrogenase family enzyme
MTRVKRLERIHRFARNDKSAGTYDPEWEERLMTTNLPLLELDAATYPDWRDGILAAEADGTAAPGAPRCYPGYPCWPLERVRPRRWGSLEQVLAQRRSLRRLATALPSRRLLSRVLQAGHGITGPLGAGPAPSAGGLQALELYLVVFETGWLPAGLYHYDRVGHHLAQLVAGAGRGDWERRVPALGHVDGGALLWVMVGDGARVAAKYGPRAVRFLLQEAGHLMQNLCLLSTSLGLATVPLGGYFERDLAHQFQLLRTDLVLYVGVCGRVQ